MRLHPALVGFGLLTLTLGAVLLTTCGSGAPKTTLPPEEDALLGYLQAAHSLAQFLQIDAPPKDDKTDPHQQFLDALAELEAMHTKAATLPAVEVKRLADRHKETVKMAQDSWKTLAAKPAGERKISGDAISAEEWARLERAFDFCRQLQPPKSAAP
jgi:hypothetical protein